jgi:hypothetical protein
MYAVAGGAFATLGTAGGVSVEMIEAVGLCGVWALAAATAGVGVEAGLFRSKADRAPRELVVALRGGALAAAGLLAWGAVLVVATLVANAGRVAELASSVGAGGIGTGLLIVASLAYLPNTVAWAAAFSLGPGFAIGTDTAVAPAAVELGLVPALPLLAGLPESVTSVVWLVVAGPIVVGALTGYFVHRELRDDASPARIAATGFGAGGVAMVLMALASSLSSGSAGDGRMAVIGPESGEVALASLLVIGAMAAGATFLLSVIAKTRAVPADEGQRESA